MLAAEHRMHRLPTVRPTILAHYKSSDEVIRLAHYKIWVIACRKIILVLRQRVENVCPVQLLQHRGGLLEHLEVGVCRPLSLPVVGVVALEHPLPVRALFPEVRAPPDPGPRRAALVHPRVPIDPAVERFHDGPLDAAELVEVGASQLNRQKVLYVLRVVQRAEDHLTLDVSLFDEVRLPRLTE